MPSRRRSARATSDLRLAIDCLPERTRIAMLDGVRGNDIIVGAYVDGEGGVCPMLAAHRNGGRTDLLAFARAWDRFTGARGRARRATSREIAVLGAAGSDLGAAIAEHGRLVASADGKPATHRRRAGDADRREELQRHAGWAWLRPFRRLDEYQRALARVGSGGGRPDGPTDEQPAAEREYAVG